MQFSSGDHRMQTIFLSVVTVSKQFFSWKIFGTSPWHIVVVEGMVCSRLWVIARDSWRVGESTW